MRLMRRYIASAITALMLVLALATPSEAAWSTKINYGSPGYVTGVDSMAVQGGICNNFEPMAYKCQTTGGVRNQVFVSNYRAYAAPYSVVQTIKSSAYLYWYNQSTNQWVQYGSPWTYSCGPAQPNQYCTFGNSSPTTGSQPWQPAFIDLPRGYSWTVAIGVTWYNYYTGQALANSFYYPGSTSAADIGCATYANQQQRCYGPMAGARLNLSAPTANVGLIKMP